LNEKIKKEYNAPQMNVVEISSQMDLLVCSGESESGIACSDDDYKD
jgi:hypothetical protein